MSKLTQEIATIVENIIEDARGKWCSHEEEYEGVLQYVSDLENLIYTAQIHNPNHELDLDFVRAHGGISQDNEKEGD